MDGPKFSIIRVNKLHKILEDDIDEFLEKNKNTTTEELHLVLHRLYQTRELQPSIVLTNQWHLEKHNESTAGPEYIK